MKTKTSITTTEAILTDLKQKAKERGTSVSDLIDRYLSVGVFLENRVLEQDKEVYLLDKNNGKEVVPIKEFLKIN